MNTTVKARANGKLYVLTNRTPIEQIKAFMVEAGL